MNKFKHGDKVKPIAGNDVGLAESLRAEVINLPGDAYYDKHPYMDKDKGMIVTYSEGSAFIWEYQEDWELVNG